MDVQLPQITQAWIKLKALLMGQPAIIADAESAEGKLSLKDIARIYPHHHPKATVEKTLLYNPIKADLAKDSHAADKDVAALPEAKNAKHKIKQQVDISPLSEHTRFIGREHQFIQLTDSVTRWQQNKGELTAVTGPAGSGVSSFLNQFHHWFLTQQATRQTEAVHITYLSFYHAALTTKETIANLCYCFNINDAPASITAAIALINKQPAHVIIIDDLHKLMLRMMGNYQALVTFATILMETRQRHCWVLGCETYVWHRLSSQYAITNFVKFVIKLDYFGLSEFRDVIQSRIAQIGLHITDNQDDDAEKLAFEQLTKQLHQATGGHSKLACVLIFHALIQDDNHPLTIAPLCLPDLTSLKQCSDDDLFSLAELYVHGGLRIFQHAEIFACSIEQSALKLEYLCRQGLIKAHYSKQDFAQHYYVITPTLTRLIASHLVNHNKLYL
ncbi:ATP-binding protein [Shewanella japonica]|uniref:ATP-binding protein n=1 Tax=Shewanella japonica TaxID=93973 RepID=UPI000E71664F|nr:ATP-binding protein [Shewanella japonica]